MEEVEEESYEERQRDELEFLQFVFMNDFEDLREKDTWKIQRPPEILIKLVPQKSISTSIRRLQISVKLHAKYSRDYPDTPPQLNLMEPHLLSNDLMKELLAEINELAKSRIGEVMMLEIAQHVQSFLHKHDRPPVSLHEEMVKRREKEAEEESKKRFHELEAQRQQREEEIAEEIERREKLLQYSDDSSSDEELEDVTKNSNNSMRSSIATHVEGTSVDVTAPPLVPHTLDDNLVTTREGNILRGKLLGESSQGFYSVYCGMDCVSGGLVSLYEWMIPCKTQRKGDTRRSRQVASIRLEYESFNDKLIKHSSIVPYLMMKHNITEHGILVEVGMEYINGGNLTGILLNSTSPITGKTLQHYSKQLLEGVAYLHSQGIVHNDIRPSLVFIDSIKGARLAGHTVIKRLSDLTGKVSEEVWPRGFFTKLGGKKTDILKLGMVVYCMCVGRVSVSYPPDISDQFNEDFKDFLNKCLISNEYQRYPAHELLVHPFITPPPFITNPIINPMDITESGVGSLVSSVSAESALFDRRSQLSCGSRLMVEFEVLEVLGKGGFGDVIKVRNYLDGRLYAIKKVKLTGGHKMMAKLTREVELLSQMNHENIVRYYNAWIENQTETDLHGNQEEEEEEEEDSDSSYSEEGSSEEEEEEDSSSFIEFKSESSTPLHHSAPSPLDSSSLTSDLFNDTPNEVGVAGGVFKGKVDTPGTTVAELLEADLMTATDKRLVIHSESSEGIVFEENSSMSASETNNEEKQEEEEEEEEGGDGTKKSSVTARRKQRNNGQLQFLYIQMEYCSNQTLRVLIDSGQLVKSSNNFELGWQLFREITEGLAHIHTQGMIHRDLKPVNIFLNSSGHVKIGDFGLATTFNKYHTGLNRQLSIPSNTSILAGDTGLVGTTLYLAPELLKPVVKYTQKVDMYSLGIILYEMSHPPLSTLMERVKILADVRKKEIVFSEIFKSSKKTSKQAYVVGLLLNHVPSERPTSLQLLNSSHIPRQIEDEQLQEAIQHTLHNPNSSQYRRLMEKLFSQENSKLVEMAYFSEHFSIELEKASRPSFNTSYYLLQQLIWNTVETIFTKHCGWRLEVSLLEPVNELLLDGSVQLLESTGKLISLPQNHWVSFSRYVLQHDITYLKRYGLFKGYSSGRVPGTHPKECRQFVFDIVSPPTATPTHNRNKYCYECELITIVSEILSELQVTQAYVRVNHSSVITTILNYCSLTQSQHSLVIEYLHKNNRLKPADIEWNFKNKLNLQLSPLALKTLIRLITTQVSLDDAHSLLEPLIRNKSSASLVKQVLQDFKSLSRKVKEYNLKHKVLFYPGLVLNPSYFDGLIFSFCQYEDQRQTKRRCKGSQLLAYGGQYNKLLERLRKKRQELTTSSTSVTSSTLPSLSGLCINEDSLSKILRISQLESGQASVSQLASNCHAVVCSLNPDIPLHDECMKLIHDLREKHHGVNVDHLYHFLELEDLQEYCYDRHIPHIIILDNSLLVRKQYKLRSLDMDKCRVVSERIVSVYANYAELVEYIAPKHSIEKNDSSESVQATLSSKSSSSTALAQVATSPSLSPPETSSSLPPITITTVLKQKILGNLKRRLDSHILSKLFPLLQQLPTKSPIEIIAIDFELEPLCQLTVEINKAITQCRDDHTHTIKLLTERYPSLGRKYIGQVCENIMEKLAKKIPFIVLYSHIADQCQIIFNNSLIA